jgi:hypothetical protein
MRDCSPSACNDAECALHATRSNIDYWIAAAAAKLQQALAERPFAASYRRGPGTARPAGALIGPASAGLVIHVPAVRTNSRCHTPYLPDRIGPLPPATHRTAWPTCTAGCSRRRRADAAATAAEPITAIA